jgi:glyoxylase-like metal-dependent hydrolase (beta-lactamase superfamily II)
VTDARTAWTEAGAYPVGAGVYRIPLPLPQDGLRAVNVYAIADGDQVVLIDSGWALADSADLLAKSLDGIGYGLGDIREFLVTHVHRDHYTQAVAIRREHRTRIALGEGERSSLEVMRESIRTGAVRGTAHLVRAGAQPLLDQLGPPSAMTDPLGVWELPDEWLANGVELPLRTRSLRVIATPGHTRGHVVFYDPDAGALFAGDHVLPHITPSIGFEVPPAESPLRDYLESLRLVRSLPDARLLPAHGPDTPSVHARVDELLDHHERRLTETAKAVEQGADTAYAAAQLLRWTRRLRPFDDLDLFNQILATTETMAHQDVLALRGWLTVTEMDGVAHYRVA